jgi:hypothetical protein
VLPLVVIGFIAAVVIGGVVWVIFAVNNGVYRDGVVLDTWSTESCGWTGPPEHQTYSCSTSYWATVSYQQGGREHLAKVKGNYEVGERTEVYVGRLGVFSSVSNAIGSWICIICFGLFVIWCFIE